MIPARAPSGRPRAAGPTRRDLLRLSGLAVGGLAASTVLSSCGSGGGEGAARFLQNKPEVVDYFTTLGNDFNASQKQYRITHDSTPTGLTPQFVRGAPPDLACYNYNLETANFVARGALTDLKSLPEAATIDPSAQALVSQFAQFGSETSVLPYSITAGGMIYNTELFAKHDVAVPTTWSELLKACQTFQAAGITPFQQTYKEGWSLRQGMFDYVTGGALDVTEFYKKLKALGGDAGPDAAVSFSKDFAGAFEKMDVIRRYTNKDAGSRSYPDGNVSFARGRTAMYFQGPWAIGEILKINPDAKIDCFALPCTDDPDDRKVRVNLDLALWIPHDSRRQDAARAFLKYLMQPEVMNAYNAKNTAWSPTKNAPPIQDPHVAGLKPYLEAKRFYQGAGTYVTETIPLNNYLQAYVLGDMSGTQLLRTLDEDWARVARRNA